MGGAAGSKLEFEQAVEKISLSQDNRIHAFDPTLTPPASPLSADPAGRPILSNVERFSDDEVDSTLEDSQESLEVMSLADEIELAPPVTDALRISPMSTPRGAPPILPPDDDDASFEPFVHSLKPSNVVAGAGQQLPSGGRPPSAGQTAFVHTPVMAAAAQTAAQTVVDTPRSRPQSARESNGVATEEGSSSTSSSSTIGGLSAEEVHEAHAELMQRSIVAGGGGALASTSLITRRVSASESSSSSSSSSN
eukprot:CAMPEP_0171923962 /NCGR_PEP_ID=MMETSP0993-20121228/22606_1 /TAXON_ID=483369 /ORGANISM="non described non described, Strain CCMP2098" /LENGTH=250 /DNA_ID=CAMNT_0012562129 /DNA_START=51 /DNA_END=800 /DNA_ORIENTATION=-